METVLRIQNINKHYPGFALECQLFACPQPHYGADWKKRSRKKHNLKSNSQHGVPRKRERHHVSKKFLSA